MWQKSRLSRYWLKGEKAGTSEVFAILPGFPDNVRTNENGEFWVAIHCRRTVYAHVMSHYPQLRKFFLKLPIPAKYQFLMFIGGRLHAVIAKYSPDGELLQILEDRQGKVVRAVSEVEEKDGKLWLGSVLMPFIAVYDLHWYISTHFTLPRKWYNLWCINIIWSCERDIVDQFFPLSSINNCCLYKHYISWALAERISNMKNVASIYLSLLNIQHVAKVAILIRSTSFWGPFYVWIFIR